MPVTGYGNQKPKRPKARPAAPVKSKKPKARPAAPAKSKKPKGRPAGLSTNVRATKTSKRPKARPTY